MRVLRVCLAGSIVAVCTSACQLGAFGSSDGGSTPSDAISGDASSLPQPNDDSDRDGVCNATEVDLRTDPDRADTDRDGLPDFTELIANYDSTDPIEPGPELVAYLPADSSASIDFEVRMTVEGSGLGYTGEFRERDALDARGFTAKDFFDDAKAVAGEPSDNVRGVQASSERFDSVLGRTRLAFMLHFSTGAVKPVGCSVGYPFEYRLKDDAGRFTSARDYLLVVVPEAARITTAGAERAKFCTPARCL